MSTGDKTTKRIGELSGDVSHKLRSPITSIQGFAELLLEDDSLKDDSREYATIILTESQKISELLNKFIEDLEKEVE